MLQGWGVWLVLQPQELVTSQLELQRVEVQTSNLNELKLHYKEEEARFPPQRCERWVVLQAPHRTVQIHSVGLRSNLKQWSEITAAHKVLKITLLFPLWWIYYTADLKSDFKAQTEWYNVPQNSAAHLFPLKSSLCIPPIQSVPVMMIMREPYGRHKHKWGQGSGKWQVAGYLHNSNNKKKKEKKNPSWQLEHDV